jgi:hypothetical protein
LSAIGKATEAISAVAPAAFTAPSATRAPTSSVTKNGLPPASASWRVRRGPGAVPSSPPTSSTTSTAVRGSSRRAADPRSARLCRRRASSGERGAGRQARITRRGRAGAARARPWATSNDAESAHWMSSRATTTGPSEHKSSTRASMSSTRRNSDPALASVSAAPKSRREISARRGSVEDRVMPRQSATTPKGRRLSNSSAWARNTLMPRPRAWSRPASRRRVLPIPASPSTTITRPWPEAAEASASPIRSSSSRRPTSGMSARVLTTQKCTGTRSSARSRR